MDIDCPIKLAQMAAGHHAIPMPGACRRVVNAVAPIYLGLLFAAGPMPGSLCRVALGDDSSQDVLKQMADSLRAQDASLRSFYVKYEFRSKILGDPADVATHLRVVVISDETREYAFSGIKRYFAFDRSLSSADEDVELIPIQSTSPQSVVARPTSAANIRVAYDGSTLRRRDPGGATGSILSPTSQEDDAAYFNPDYMATVFRVPPDVLNRTNTRERNRLLGLIELGACRVREGNTVVDGAECVVVETQGDIRIVAWCDPARGYAVLRTEGYYPESNWIMWRSHCRALREVANGVWFPSVIITERCASPEAGEILRDMPLLQYERRVIEMVGNSVPDDIFALKFPPGLLVLDYERGSNAPSGEQLARGYRVADDGTLIEQRVRALQPAEEGSRGWSTSAILITINALALLVFGLWLARRWRQMEGGSGR